MKNIYLLPEMGIIPSLSQKEEVIISPQKMESMRLSQFEMPEQDDFFQKMNLFSDTS